MDFPPAESIFGGITLLFVIALIFTGKIRLEREVTFRDKLLEIKDEIIEEQNTTVATLIENAKITHKLLREIRAAAYGEGHRFKDESGDRL